MLTQALQTRSDILVASQSSTRGGVTVNRAMLADVTSEIGEISFAIQQQTGGTVRTSYPDMSNGNSGGRRCC